MLGRSDVIPIIAMLMEENIISSPRAAIMINIIAVTAEPTTHSIIGLLVGLHIISYHMRHMVVLYSYQAWCSTIKEPTSISSTEHSA